MVIVVYQPLGLLVFLRQKSHQSNIRSWDLVAHMASNNTSSINLELIVKLFMRDEHIYFLITYKHGKAIVYTYYDNVSNTSGALHSTHTDAHSDRRTLTQTYTLTGAHTHKYSIYQI